MPDLPISAIEIEVIKQARAALPKAMQRLIQLSQSKNPSQSRQAIELLFKYGLADRQQQFDIQGNPLDDHGGKQISISLNKFELQLNEVMKVMSPETKVEFARLIDKMQSEADDQHFDIVEGIVVDEPEFKRCECGCGEAVNPGARFIRGHQLRGHMTHKRIPPHEIRRLKATGQWEEYKKDHFGIDKRKAAAAKKKQIKQKRANKKSA